MTALHRAFGFRLWNNGEGIGSDDLNDTSAAILTQLHDLGIARRHAITRTSGVLQAPDGFAYGLDAHPRKGSGDRDVRVNDGVVWIARGSGTPGIRAPELYPVCVPSVTDLTAAAHDATNPRIDAVVMAIDEETDSDTGTRRIRQAGPGSATTASLSAHRASVGTVSLVTGTPDASPSAPSAPSGSVTIGIVRVPATSGAVVVESLIRPPLPGEGFEPIPDGEYSRNRVVSGCAVTAASSGDLAVDVAAGVVDIYSRRFTFDAYADVALATADATHPRIDGIWLYEGNVYRVTGTPASSPTETEPSASIQLLGVKLATVLVPATATVAGDLTVTSARPLRPYTQDHIEYPVPRLSVTAAAIDNDQGTITVVVYGAPEGASGRLLVELYEDDGTPTAKWSSGNTFSGGGMTTEAQYGWSAAVLASSAGIGGSHAIGFQLNSGSARTLRGKVTLLDDASNSAEDGYTSGACDAFSVSMPAP